MYISNVSLPRCKDNKDTSNDNLILLVRFEEFRSTMRCLNGRDSSRIKFNQVATNEVSAVCRAINELT